MTKIEMTNEEAIKWLNVERQLIVEVPQDNSKELKEAYDMAIQALEKDIAKEPVQTHKRYGHGNEYNDYYCPECDEFLAYEPQGNGYKQEGGWSRCINCGQRIKWEDKE